MNLNLKEALGEMRIAGYNGDWREVKCEAVSATDTTLTIKGLEDEPVTLTVIEEGGQLFLDEDYEVQIQTHRVCSECGKIITKGYMVGGGCEYYCDDNDDACLHKHHTAEEWDEMCDDGDSDENYWTDWLD